MVECPECGVDQFKVRRGMFGSEDSIREYPDYFVCQVCGSEFTNKGEKNDNG